jgi:caffeoyl-CoA O-methyltransferase
MNPLAYLAIRPLVVFLVLPTLLLYPAAVRGVEMNTPLDEQVQAFLNRQAGQWRDMNVPAVDGQVLHDLIIRNNYQRAVEIGTSTGHSAIWMAWALSKTGGRLITVEIDDARYRQALENFEQAGLSDYIDARLADAHELVHDLEGPFDFVFIDADKSWYKNYFMALAPKLKAGGCITAHNVSQQWSGILEYLEYVNSRVDFTTTIDQSSRAGISISCTTIQK